MRAPVGRTAVYTLGVVSAVGMLVVASCGEDSSSTASTLRPIVTTSTVAATVAPLATNAPVTVGPAPASPATTVPATTVPATTVPADSSTAPASAAATTTAVPATVAPTTIPAGAALVLRSNGVGDAAFGADDDEVVAYIRSILGTPTADSGWADPFSSFGVCPGTEVRGVTWGDLTLLFSDESVVATGRRHFFTYNYGPAFSAGIDPAGLATTDGLTVGSTVAELRSVFPLVVVNPGDEIFASNFYIDDNFTGFLTGPTDADTIVSITGGIGCGE